MPPPDSALNEARVTTPAATSVTAFVGATEQGPANVPAHVFDFNGFRSIYGDLSTFSHLGQAVRQFFENGGREACVVRSGDEHAPPLGDRAQRTGLYALEDVDSFNLLCLPGVADAGVLRAAESYAKERGALLLIDTPVEAQSPEQLLAALGTWPRTSQAALYYPWIYLDPASGIGARTLVPPCGSIAGLLARTDAERGVWKAPAGSHAKLHGVRELAQVLSDEQCDRLEAAGVNCLRMVGAIGAVCWSARTRQDAYEAHPEMQHVPVRRMADFIEESLVQGLEWTIFENNDARLWTRIALQAESFMHTLFAAGAFQGGNPREGYWVKCDRETTTWADIDVGHVTLGIGFAPLRPAEFVSVEIQLQAEAPAPARG